MNGRELGFKFLVLAKTLTMNNLLQPEKQIPLREVLGVIAFILLLLVGFFAVTRLYASPIGWLLAFKLFPVFLVGVFFGVKNLVSLIRKIIRIL